MVDIASCPAASSILALALSQSTSPAKVLRPDFYGSPTVGVLLFQAAGKRRWAIEGSQSSDEEERTRSVQDIDVRVLADFKESQVESFLSPPQTRVPFFFANTFAVRSGGWRFVTVGAVRSGIYVGHREYPCISVVDLTILELRPFFTH